MFFTFLWMWLNTDNLPPTSLQPWFLLNFLFFYTIQTAMRVSFYLDLVWHIASELTVLAFGESLSSIIHLNAFVQACSLLVDLSKNWFSWWFTTHGIISDSLVHVFIHQDILNTSEACSWFSPSPHLPEKLECQAMDNLIFSAIYGLLSLSVI